MRRPIAAAVLTLAAGALGGCSSLSQTPVVSTATVTVNGIEAKFNVVKCTQVQWYRTIHIGSNLAGVTVIVDGRAARASVESVQIQNVGGFTGRYSQGAGEEANTRFDGGTYLVTGVAAGSSTAKPNEASTADFKISAKC